jgi:hypothetical protein
MGRSSCANGPGRSGRQTLRGTGPRASGIRARKISAMGRSSARAPRPSRCRMATLDSRLERQAPHNATPFDAEFRHGPTLSIVANLRNFLIQIIVGILSLPIGARKAVGVAKSSHPEQYVWRLRLAEG